MSSPADWSRAYARQAKADWFAYERLLLHGDVPPSEPFHLLQMALEKLVKAHLYPSHPDPGSLQRTHSVIEKHLPTIFRNVYARHQRVGNPSGAMMVHVRRVAHEIDCLQPANDAGGSRPDNCEYPWEDIKQAVHVPAEHSFGGMNLANGKWWLELVKIIKFEMNRLAAA